MDVLTSWITGNWKEIKDFFNSVFFTSIAGSLAGAFAGAYAAQRIAERGKYRDQLLREIRDANAAITIAGGICNSLLGLKKQHIKALKENFDGQKAALEEHKRRINAGEIPQNAEFRFLADLQTLSLPPLPINVLQRQVFETLSVRGRPLSLTATLGQVVHGLGTMLEKRNQLIESYKAAGELAPHLYFGLPKDGNVNADYPTAIDAIYSHTDDGIFFSDLLCKDLMEHGKGLKAQFTKTFGKGAPQISEVNFAAAADLIPNPNNYSDWLTKFRKHEPPKGRFARFRDWLKSWWR